MSEKNKKPKKPFLALILSAILPGLGQIYNNQFLKGLLFIVLNMLINILLMEPALRVRELIEKDHREIDNPTLIIVAGYTIAGLILWIYAILDAKKTAETINEGIN